MLFYHEAPYLLQKIGILNKLSLMILFAAVRFPKELLYTRVNNDFFKVLVNDCVISNPLSVCYQNNN